MNVKVMVLLLVKVVKSIDNKMQQLETCMYRLQVNSMS